MKPWFVHLIELLIRNCRFRVHMGDDISRWHIQANGLPHGSVLAPILFNLYTNDLPTTSCRRFICADDICCVVQNKSFTEIESILSDDVTRMAKFCQQWRLKPSTTKTITSVFHLHNASASRELSVSMDGQPLKHEQFPVYLVVTLDRILSYRQHLQKSAAKVKSRNNLLFKLAGST